MYLKRKISLIIIKYSSTVELKNKERILHKLAQHPKKSVQFLTHSFKNVTSSSPRGEEKETNKMADVDATCICQFYISQIKLEIQFNLSYTVLQYWPLKGRSREFDIK